MEWMAHDYQKCVKAYKQKNWKNLEKHLKDLGGEISHIYYVDDESGISIDTEGMWKANPDEL